MHGFLSLTTHESAGRGSTGAEAWQGGRDASADSHGNEGNGHVVSWAVGAIGQPLHFPEGCYFFPPILHKLCSKIGFKELAPVSLRSYDKLSLQNIAID